MLERLDKPYGVCKHISEGHSEELRMEPPAAVSPFA